MELEHLWRDRVQHARRRYKEKAVITDALAAECQRLLGWDDPVIELTFCRTLRLEHQALPTYQLLKTYTDLVVHGTAPTEDA